MYLCPKNIHPWGSIVARSSFPAPGEEAISPPRRGQRGSRTNVTVSRGYSTTLCGRPRLAQGTPSTLRRPAMPVWPASFERCVRRTRESPGGPRAYSAAGMTGCPWSVLLLAEPRLKGIQATFRQAKMIHERDNLAPLGFKRLLAAPFGYLRVSLRISKISPISASRF